MQEEPSTTHDAHAGVVTPEPQQSTAVRLVIAVALTFGFVIAQSLGIVAVLGVATALGIDHAPLRDIAKAYDDPALLTAMALADAGVAGLFAIGSVSITGSLAALAIRSAGALRSLALTTPLLVLGVGLPAAVQLASGKSLIAGNVDGSLAATIVLLSVCVAVCEEVVFRGAIITSLGAGQRPWLSVFVSAGLFSALHASVPGGGAAVAANLIQVIGFIAIPFACIRIISDSIIGLIVTHALIDTFGLLELGGYQLADPPSVGAIVVQGLFSTTCAVAYLLWFRSRRQRQQV